MKKFFLGFAEGYFIVAMVIYIATALTLKKPINVLFYPSTYPFLFGLFYLAIRFGDERSTENK